MKTAIIVFPGTNREKDMGDAILRVTGRAADRVWHRETRLDSYDLVIVPGGFSYGDYLRCGAMAGTSPIMRAVAARAQAGGAVLGICNGFQILTEAGLLPGALLRNAGLKFFCGMIHVKVENHIPPFTQGLAKGRVMRIAAAHNEGNYFTDDDTLSRLEGEGRIAFRYCTADGTVHDSANPNGSRNHIAGIFNDAGNVLGMMPHPENAVDPLTGGTGGLDLFATMARHFVEAA